MSHAAIIINAPSNSQPASTAAEDRYLPEWFTDSVEGACSGMLSHAMMERCAEMLQENPESLAPYVIPVIWFMVGGVVEMRYQAKISTVAAGFFGSFAASKLPWFGLTEKGIQYLAAAATGAGFKRLTDRMTQPRQALDSNG